MVKFGLMAGNTFGSLFRITSFGESHGPAVGVVIDGFPSGFKIDLKKVQVELDRRRPGQSKITSPRKEKDELQVLSGMLAGKTTGAPISVVVWNKDAKPADYTHIKSAFRPSHADYTYSAKYGIRDASGGGRSSARATIAKVIAGAFARQFLKGAGIDLIAYVSQVGEIEMKSHKKVSRRAVESNIVRCPEKNTANEMIALIEDMRDSGDTIGGTVTCRINGAPVGLGEPLFDKLHADLGKAMLSINAVKGFDYGSGFNDLAKKGSELNDEFEVVDDVIKAKTNNSGGIQGGISNGEEIYFRVAFKPVSTLMKDQWSVSKGGKKQKIKGKGRHDPCVLPRAVPIVENFAAVVLMDHYLRNKKVYN